MSKATSRSVNNSAISTIVVVILTAIIAGSVVFVGTYAYFALQFAPAQQLVTQPKPALQKFKASGYSANLSEQVFLLLEAGKERGIWASYGLDPEWVTIPGRFLVAADLKDQVSSGIEVGLSTSAEVLLARANGVPIKIVASYIGETRSYLVVRADSPIKTIKDLDGKKFGVISLNHWTYRSTSYLSNKFEIKTEAVPLGNVTSEVVALKLRKIDAFISSQSSVLRLVDSGELRILLRFQDVYPTPLASVAVFAAEDLIVKNPDLVRRFVRATLESVRYLKDNPRYTADLYIKITNAPRDLAEKAIQHDWQPAGRGSGSDLVAGVANTWQVVKDSGAISLGTWEKVKIEDAVDVRFLP